MNQILAMLMAVAIGIGSAGGSVSAQVVVVPSFPASAIIRGENIRLRAEPADSPQDLAVLQRGDEITITGAAETAAGLTFYPVEVVQTGDVGWVRELFINPKSIVPLLEAAPVAEPAPEAAEPNAEDDRASRRERRERRNAEAGNETPADEAPADEAPAEEPAAELPADEATVEPEAEQPAADDEPQAPPADEGDEPAAEEPAEEPAEDPAAAPAASVAGEDAMATEPFALEPGRYRVTATLEASDATGFVVNLLGPRDFNEPLFEDEVDSAQSWTVRSSVTVERQGDYVVEVVEAAGTWVIEFELR